MDKMREAFEKEYPATEGLSRGERAAYWGVWQAAQAESQQTIAGLQALLKEKDEALQAISDPDSNHPYFMKAAYNKKRLDEVYEDIAEEALSHTSPTDALERYDAELQSQLAATLAKNEQLEKEKEIGFTKIAYSVVYQRGKDSCKSQIAELEKRIKESQKQPITAWQAYIDGSPTQNFARDSTERQIMTDIFSRSSQNKLEMSWLPLYAAPVISEKKEEELIDFTKPFYVPIIKDKP